MALDVIDRLMTPENFISHPSLYLGASDLIYQLSSWRCYLDILKAVPIEYV